MIKLLIVFSMFVHCRQRKIKMAHANGEGTIYKRMRDGRHVGYVGALTYFDIDGEPKRLQVYGATRAEVRSKLREASDRIDGGAPPRDTTRTVADWLAHWRATTLAVSDRKRVHQGVVRQPEPQAPGAPALRCDHPRPAAAHRHRELGAGSACQAAVRLHHRSSYTVIRAGLDGAVRDGLLARNPAAQVNRPGIERLEARHLEGDEVGRLLAAEAHHRHQPVLCLIAATGLRRREARWRCAGPTWTSTRGCWGCGSP